MLWSVFGGLAYSLVFLVPETPAWVTFMFTLSSLAVAFCDVVADAMVAEYAKLESGRGAGNLQVASRRGS